jgi:hypothetical protein
MATRQVLAELVESLGWSHEVVLESVGVSTRPSVCAGEPIDAVVLAADVIDQLIGRQDRGRKQGRPRPIRRIDRGSTGRLAAEIGLRTRSGVPCSPRAPSATRPPSGAHLARLFERWGVADAVKSRIVPRRRACRSVRWWPREGRARSSSSELIHPGASTCWDRCPRRSRSSRRSRRRIDDVDAAQRCAMPHVHGIARRAAAKRRNGWSPYDAHHADPAYLLAAIALFMHEACGAH